MEATTKDVQVPRGDLLRFSVLLFSAIVVIALCSWGAYASFGQFEGMRSDMAALAAFVVAGISPFLYYDLYRHQHLRDGLRWSLYPLAFVATCSASRLSADVFEPLFSILAAAACWISLFVAANLSDWWFELKKVRRGERRL